MRELGPSPTHPLLHLLLNVHSAGASTGGRDIVFRVIRVVRGASPRGRKNGSSAALIILLAATAATERIASALHGIICHVAHPAATLSPVGSNASAVAVETVASSGTEGKLVLGRLQAEPGWGRYRLAVDGPDGAVGWIGNCTEVRGQINTFPVELPAAIEGQQAQGRKDMVRLESDTEENEEDKVFGQKDFNLLYPREVVTTDIEGDRGQVQGDGSLNPVQRPVQKGCERWRRVGLGGRVYLVPWEGRHFGQRAGKSVDRPRRGDGAEEECGGE